MSNVVGPPQTAEAWNNQAQAKQVKGDLDGALADFNRAIELKPAFAVAYSNRSLVKEAKGDLTGALDDADMAVALNRSLPVSYNNRGFTSSTRRAIWPGHSPIIVWRLN